MKMRWKMATCMTLVLVAGGVALAQDRAPQRADQKFSQGRSHERRAQPVDHDRHFGRGWYIEHTNHALVALKGRASVLFNMEPRPEIRSAFDPKLRTKMYSGPPIDLWHRVTPPPRSYQFVATGGGHVAAIDDKYQDLSNAVRLTFTF